ncbi:DUF3231 family protein [Cohnella caldifontis]|uniref:DUF3231 family protein n=1 Tax=Cohnella caldifontis TaxID=3027471 RepID=UPI0023ECEC2B|nr:DUF3231 family protein [Cohnella sp. YIM B05605]
MKHLFQALADFVKSMHDEEPKPPLHIGEVMNCWVYLTVLEEAIMLELTCLNHTVDPELKENVGKSMNGAVSQSRRLKDFLQREGVPLPPVSEPKPQSDPNAVPLGAKFTDDEIANLVSVKLASAVTFCAASASQSIRNDVGKMFMEFQEEAMIYGILMKTLMRKRGWLKIPPYFMPPGAPNPAG